MSDIATISLRVNTSSLEKGTQELDKFRKAAQGGAGSADELSQSVDETHRRVDELRKRLADSESATKKNASAQDELASAFYKQIDSIKNAAKETDNIAAIRARLHAAQKSGNLIQEDYLALLSAITAKQIEGRRAEESAAAAREVFLKKLKDQVATTRLSREELLRYRAEQLGAGSAAEIYIQKLKKAEEGTARFNTRTAAASKNLRNLATSLVRSNLGGVAGTGTSFLGNIGALTPQVTVLAGAVAGLGTAYYKGQQESSEFNKQLVLTGNYAGRTTGQLNNLAKAISGNGITRGDAAAALAKVVGSGSFKSSQIESITRAAVAMQEATGRSVDETIKNFQKLYDSPTKGSAELNTQMNYLTAAQYEYISSLERRGDKEAAGQAAADVYSRAEQQRSQQILDNLGLIERSALVTRNAFKSMWDELLNIGRADSDATKLQTMKETLAEIQENSKQGVWGRFKNNSMGVNKSRLEANIKNLEFVIKSQEGYNEKKAEFNQINKDGINAQISFNKYLDAGTTQAEKRALAQRDLNKAIADNAKAAKATQSLEEKERVKLWTPEEIAKARAGIEKLHKDPKQSPKTSAGKMAGTRADDAAQADLLTLKAQLEVLKQHQGANDFISQQRKHLWQVEAKYQVLGAAAQKRQLSDQEKSLLAGKDRVLNLEREKAAIGDQIVLQGRLNKLQDESDKYIKQMSERRKLLADSAGKSNRQIERESAERKLKNDWRDKGGSLDDPALTKQLKELKQFYAEEDALRGDWLAGARKGWAEYEDSVTNVNENIANVTQGAFMNMSNSLSDFFITGKANFSDFLTTFLKGITQMLTQLAVLNAAKAAFGGTAFGNLLGIKQAYVGGYIPEFDVGGYTGAGGKYEPKGIVHGGEFVFTKEATSAIGVENLYALMRNAKGYAEGGVVGRAPMYGLSGGGLTVNVDAPVAVTQERGAGGSNSNRKGAENIGNLVKSVVQQEVTTRLRKELAEGGVLYKRT